MTRRTLALAAVLLLLAALALGLHILQLRQIAEQVPSQAALPPPPQVTANAGPRRTVMLYVADDATGVLRPRQVEMNLPAEPAARGREVLRALAALYREPSSTHPLGSAAEVRQVYLVEPDIAVVDVNAEFVQEHRSGIQVESLTIASLVGTLERNLPAVRRVKIVVAGQERETLAGHADLARFYETDSAERLARLEP